MPAGDAVKRRQSAKRLNYENKWEAYMNFTQATSLPQTQSSSAEQAPGYQVKVGRDLIRVVSIFDGTKTASEVIHEAAVKKILYDRSER